MLINVTKTYLPNRKMFDSLIDKIWDNAWLTNYGPLVNDLEEKLREYFNVEYLFLVNNGTIALQIALKSLGFEGGEIITTPFSYVATTSAIVWEGFKPVFVDIKPDSLTIDPTKIEAAITKETRALMPVHVYGIPCDVEEINHIAQKHNLKVIYDAAHAFGVKYKDNSVLRWGNISTLSFHATKLFHTIEGGAIITDDEEIAQRISYMRNFGHKTPISFQGIGINGKMNEFCAAMGLTVLPEIDNIVKRRRLICELYDHLIKTTSLIRPVINKDVYYNFAYYPVIFPDEKSLLKADLLLRNNNIIPRRYFYPSLNNLPYITSSPMPISDDICSRILCLPLYDSLTEKEVVTIVGVIKSLW